MLLYSLTLDDEYQGYINLINKQTDIEDLNYIRKDIDQACKTIEVVKKKIREGDASNKYVKAGITVKDCNETIKWFKDIAKKAINDKIKSLK